MTATRVVLYTSPRTTAQMQHKRYNAHSASELGSLVDDFDLYKEKFVGKTGGIFDVPRTPEAFSHLIDSFGLDNISVVSIDQNIEAVTPDEFKTLTQHLDDTLNNHPDFLRPKQADSRIVTWLNQRHL